MCDGYFPEYLMHLESTNSQSRNIESSIHNYYLYCTVIIVMISIDPQYIELQKHTFLVCFFAILCSWGCFYGVVAIAFRFCKLRQPDERSDCDTGDERLSDRNEATQGATQETEIVQQT